MAVAAKKPDLEDEWVVPPSVPAIVTPGPIRCLVIDEGLLERAVLQAIARDSLHEIEFVECKDASAARALLASGEGDILVIDGRIDAQSPVEIAQTFNADSQLAEFPVIYITGEMDAGSVVAALRAGVSDCLRADALTAEGFDQAVVNALRRGQGTVADQRALISNLRAENETLRRIAVRNMRLLKGQALPLMSLAWRMLRGDPVPEAQRARTAKGLARLTRNVTGLIDDTVIVAATHKANDTDEAIALNELIDSVMREDLGEISSSRAHIVVHDLPVIRARRAHMAMLFEELILTAVRHGRIGQVPEIEIGAGQDSQGNPVIWFSERGLQLSARKQTIAQRADALGQLETTGAITDSHAWSLCQRLVEKNNGVFRITDNDGHGSKLMMRFPKKVLVASSD